MIVYNILRCFERFLGCKATVLAAQVKRSLPYAKVTHGLRNAK